MTPVIYCSWWLIFVFSHKEQEKQEEECSIGISHKEQEKQEVECSIGISHKEQEKQERRGLVPDYE